MKPRLQSLFAVSAALAAVALASATVAKADGMGRAAPAATYAAPFSWSGFYIGAHPGWEWSSSDVTFAGPPPHHLGIIDQDTGIYGVQAGYQQQFGSFVLGVEGNITESFRDELGRRASFNPALLSAARFDNLFTIGGRAGWVAGNWAGGNWAGGKWMPYVTGGYASARFEEQGIFRVTGVTFDQDSERHDGWYIGGGLDWAFSDHIIVGVEYRHFEFETRNYKEFGVP